MEKEMVKNGTDGCPIPSNEYYPMGASPYRYTDSRYPLVDVRKVCRI
jgi:hypothetical protein